MRPRDLLPALIAATTALAGQATVSAATQSTNEATADLTVTAGPDWYRYGTGTDLATIGETGDTYVDTVTDAAGAVTLARLIPGAAAPDAASVPWWDTTWQARHCSSATGSGVHIVDVPFDSTSPAGWAASGWVQPDYGDVRAVVWDGGSNTVTPFWLATPYDTMDGHAFVQVDLGAGSTRSVCLYFGHATGGLATTSTAMLGQNWGSLEHVYTRINPEASPRIYVANPTLAPVTIAQSAGGASSLTLAPGATAVYVLIQDTLYADGAVTVRGTHTTRADESLTPMFHSGTLFVSRTNRGVQRWCFAGAAGTTITIDTSNLAPYTFALDPASPCHIRDTNRHTVITSSAPVSVFHVTNGRRDDPHVLYPATADPLYGVPSNHLRIGVSEAGTVELANSSTTTIQTLTLGADGGDHAGAGSYGAPPAFRVTGVSPVLAAAIQQADGNGLDSTSLLPIEAMSSRYVIPVRSSYVAIACPRPGEVLLVNGSPSTCAGANVGYLKLGTTAAGTVIESASGAAFTLYYHPGSDETNIFTPRLDWAQVETTGARIESALVGNGTWTSIRSATTDVWGLFTPDVTLPAGTAVEWEVACATTSAGPFTYTPILPGAPLPHACDDVDTISVRATLTSTDRLATPTIAGYAVEHSLAIEPPSAIVTYDLTATGRTWLWRIHDSVTSIGSAGSRISTADGIGSGDYIVSLVDDAMSGSAQVSAVAPTAADLGGAPVTVHRSSIAVDTTVLPAATDAVWWSTLGTVRAERTIELG